MNTTNLLKKLALLLIVFCFISTTTRANALKITDWLNSEQYQSVFNEYLAQGYYPKFVQGKLSSGVELYQGFFDNDYPSQYYWYSCHSLNSSDFATLDAIRRQQGYYPYWHQSYTGNNNIVRHQATWLKTDMMRILALSNGQIVNNIDDGTSAMSYYSLAIPVSTKHIIVSASNNDNCTIRANYNKIPSQYDSYTLSGNNLILNNPPSGILYIAVSSDASSHNATLSASTITEYGEQAIQKNSIVSISKTTLATDAVVALEASAKHPLLYVGNAKGCTMYTSNDKNFAEEKRMSTNITQQNTYISLSEYNGITVYAKLFCQDKNAPATIAAVSRCLSINQQSKLISPSTFLLMKD